MNFSGPMGIVGFGTMGSGMAHVCAQAGFDVIVLDLGEREVQRGYQRLQSFLRQGVERGKLTNKEVRTIVGRVRGVTDVEELAGVDLVLEAASEKFAIKAEVLARVSQRTSSGTLIATNTSGMSVTKLAAHVLEPQRFAGLHFFNPPQLMQLVEVAPALQTAPETVDQLEIFSRRIGKHPIRVKDTPGFLVNRLLIPYLNQVIQALDDGLASPDDIDSALQLGLGYPLGGLELLDLIGLDNHLAATETLYRETGQAPFAPPPLLRRMVDAGYLGRKAGRGFRNKDTES